MAALSCAAAPRLLLAGRAPDRSIPRRRDARHPIAYPRRQAHPGGLVSPLASPPGPLRNSRLAVGPGRAGVRVESRTCPGVDRAAGCGLDGRFDFLLALFLRVEHRAPDALLDLSLFGDPSFSVASATLVLSFVSSHVLTFLLPFYLCNPSSAGRQRRSALAAHALVRVWAAPWSGAWSDRSGQDAIILILRKLGMMPEK